MRIMHCGKQGGMRSTAFKNSFTTVSSPLHGCGLQSAMWTLNRDKDFFVDSCCVSVCRVVQHMNISVGSTQKTIYGYFNF